MFANERVDFADALSTVDGITGHVLQPSVTREGDAWPQLARISRGLGQTWQPQWVVFVVLPTDVQAAVEFTDEVYDALADALMPVLFVEDITPVKLEIEGGTRPALQITGRSE